MAPNPIVTIFITHPYVPAWNFSGKNLKYLQNLLPELNVKICSSPDKFEVELPNTEIALIWYFKQEWLSFAPKLKWIITPAAGRDYFHIPPSSGVDVDYGHFQGELMGETVLGMMLAQARGIREAILLSRDHSWPRDLICKRMKPLRGSHLVILGFGHIGRWIGRLAKPFGMRIIGVKRKLVPPPPYFDDQDSVITVNNLEEVLPEADHLVLSLPGGADTTDIIDKKRLNLLPSNAVIYNVGRGNAINEPALIEALTHNKIEAAYLDVVKTEPLPADSALRKCPNLFIMPHASAISPNYLDLFIREFAEKYKARYGK